MSVLYPPVLDAQGPAFRYYSEADDTQGIVHFLKIRFQMPVITPVDQIKHLQVSLKYAENGEAAVNKSYSPDNQTLFISTEGWENGKNMYFEKEATGNFVIKIPYACFGGGRPYQDRTYMVQVRFGANDLWAENITGLEFADNWPNFAFWRQNATTRVPSLFGEWSNLQKIYCHGDATHQISYNFEDFVPEVVWHYSPVGDDPVEQIKLTYRYNNLHGNIFKTEVFNGQYNDDNTFGLRQKLKVAPVVNIHIGIEAVTKNNTKYNDEITIPSLIGDYSTIELIPGEISDFDLSVQEAEDGIIAKSIILPDAATFDWLYNVYRISILSLECVKVIKDQQILKGELFTFKDFTVEMGEEYQYVVLGKNPKTSKSYFLTDLKPFGPKNKGYARLMRMDSAYLTTRNHQLRLQGNLQITNLKRNTQDTFQTTIGSQYPYFSRASQINYRSFNINGVVSINFDPTATFMRLDAIGSIALFDTIGRDEYSVLITASPGVAKYFRENYNVDTKEFTYTFIGTQPGDPLSQQACIDLVNRCAAAVILNGLWWDSEDGDSVLWLQDKDIMEHEEISLSRRRTHEVDNPQNASLSVLGMEDESDVKGQMSVYGDYLHRQSKIVSGTVKTDKLIFVERKFREKVMEWLSDGKPKLFRSETEGNMIVQISAATFSPLQGTNRMVYTVQMTATEIAEFNSENLINYNLIPSNIKSIYVGNSAYDYIWGQEDPNVIHSLRYVYDEKYDIPTLVVGDSSNPIDINTYPAVHGGMVPFTFSEVDDSLPPGLTIDPASGHILGYPSKDEIAATMSPGFAVLQVTDAEGATAKMRVPYGYIVLPLKLKETIYLTPKNGDSFLVGELITEAVATDYFTGGGEPFTFSGVNLPVGINVDPKTGRIYGSYGEATEENAKPAYILVRDVAGQLLQIPVDYSASVYPLTFNKIASWDYNYTEVGTPIPEINLMDGVVGGVPPYTFTDVEGQRLPDGWLLGDGTGDKPNGLIYGTPTKATAYAGSFQIKVTDSKGSERTQTIYYNRILEKFEFIWRESFDVLRDENGNLNPITVGTNIDKVDLSPGVSGGLPYATGAPYRFEAIGLLPNFRISQYGIITGQAKVSLAEHQAEIFVLDARGKRIPIKGNRYQDPPLGINISAVTGSLTVLISRFDISGLYQDTPITEANVQETDLDGIKSNTLKITQDSFRKEGATNYEVSASGFPTGLTIEKKTDPITKEAYWVFTGSPRTSYPNTTGWIQVSEKISGEIVQIPVYFNAVIGSFVWDPWDNTIMTTPETRLDKVISGLSGGRPTYDIQIKEIEPASEKDWMLPTDNTVNFHVVPADKSSTQGWRLVGTMADKSTPRITITLEATDADNKKVTTQVVIMPTTKRLRLNAKDSLVGKILIVNHAVIKKMTIVEAEGGTPPYRYFYSGGKLPGGLTLNQADGSIEGTPTELNTALVDIGSKFYVLDKNDNRADCRDVWILPAIVKEPRIAAAIGAEIKTTTMRHAEPPLALGSAWDSKPYFTDFNFPDTQIKITKGTLPPELKPRFGTSDYKIEGMLTAAKGPLEVEFTLTTPKTDYDEAIIKVLTVAFEGVASGMIWPNQGGFEIEATGVGNPIKEVLLTENFKDGLGPFNWTVEPALPANLKLNVSNGGRTATISGTAAAAAPTKEYKVTVTDTATQTSISQTILFRGFYPPIVVNGSLTIPPMKGGADLTAIDATSLVSGGSPPYTLTDDNLILFNYGYGVEGMKIVGKATEESRAAGTGVIQVKDSKGQKANISVTIGEITGLLGFDAKAATGPIEIKPGKVNTTLPADELIKLAGGAQGGTPPYVFSEWTAETGWKQRGWTCTMDANGNFSAIKRPATPIPAGSFQVQLRDGAGTTLMVNIKYGAVTA